MVEIKIKVKESDKKPRCPHCSKEIDKLNEYTAKNSFIGTYLFTCTECHKIVGLSPYQ